MIEAGSQCLDDEEEGVEEMAMCLWKGIGEMWCSLTRHRRQSRPRRPVRRCQETRLNRVTAEAIPNDRECGCGCDHRTSEIQATTRRALEVGVLTGEG